ncbi:hypothetical protein BT93_K0684 [Corymbia citriodora subsp. variegata]|nr:hypothetical protein BT93_K0684 [Corymbia citriodora subsp. variegata]
MANKLVAVFLVCIVLAGAMHVQEAEATSDSYKACFTGCHDGCKPEHGFSFCEVKCDTECTEKEVAGKNVGRRKKRKKITEFYLFGSVSQDFRYSYSCCAFFFPFFGADKLSSLH